MAGFREFVTGEVLTAANVDDFLAKQAVMKFADAAARDSALGTAVAGGNALREGMVAYLDDTDEVIKYDGTDWSSVGEASGLVAVKHVTKTDTQTISQASGAITAVTGLSIAHAAADAANKIVLFGVLTGHQGTTEGQRGGVMLHAGGTAIESPTSPGARQPTMSFMGGPVDQTGTGMRTVNVMAVYSPASTSSVTYDLRVSNGTNATRTFYINRSATDTDNIEFPRGVSTLMLMEVKV